MSGIKSGSGNSDAPIYSWTSNCPGATFDNASSATPKISLVTIDSNGAPVSCQVTLTVTNSLNASTNCQAQIAGGVCIRDCHGKLNGTAQNDRCGVCEGNGQSCVPCQTLNIKGTQLALDINAASLRNAVFKISARLTEALTLAKVDAKIFNSVVKSIKNSNVNATTIYNKSWTDLWTGLPSSILSCQPNPFCVEVSTASITSLIRTSAQTLDNIVVALNKQINNLQLFAKRTHSKNLTRITKLAKESASVVATAAKLTQASKNNLATIPVTSSSCN